MQSRQFHFILRLVRTIALILLLPCVLGFDRKTRDDEGSSTCKPVSVQKDFDLDTYISKPWHIQQQMETSYLPKENNFCVRAHYVKKKASFWNKYSGDIYVYNEARIGSIHGVSSNSTKSDGSSKLCAALGKEPAKLTVAPCFLPVSLLGGPYWVLEYNEVEGFSLVSGGQPTIPGSDGCRTGSGTNNAGLWIFTRKQERDQALVDKVRGLAREQGFDLSVLNDVVQEGCKYEGTGAMSDKELRGPLFSCDTDCGYRTFDQKEMCVPDGATPSQAQFCRSQCVYKSGSKCAPKEAAPLRGSFEAEQAMHEL